MNRKRPLIRFNAPARISFITSLLAAIVAVVGHIFQVPGLAPSAFWLLAGAYSFLLWSTVLRGM